MGRDLTIARIDDDTCENQPGILHIEIWPRFRMKGRKIYYFTPPAVQVLPAATCNVARHGWALAAAYWDL